MRRMRGQLCLCAAFLLCAACILPSLLRAQTGGNVFEPGEADQRAYTLTGTVVNSVTGEPLSRAVVQLNANGQRSTFTDREGRFQFSGLPLLQASLVAHKPNFFNENEVFGHGRSAPQVVAIGPDTPPVVLKLFPEAVIVGHVSDAGGSPLEGATLSLITSRIVNGRKQWQQRGGASSDENGEFRIANLTPGSYYVVARPRLSPSLFAVNGSAKQGAFPVVYYPDAPDLAGATPIQLTAGQHAQIEFTVRPSPVFSITGIVTGYTFGQGVNLQFVSNSGDSISSNVRFNPDTGSFQARLVSAGPCILKANAQDPAGQPLYAEKTLNLTGNLVGIHLALAPALSIPIIVRTETTKPQPENEDSSTNHATRRPAPVSIHLNSLDRLRPDAWSTTEGAPDNPTLAFRNIQEGRYRVESTAQNGLWYVKSITYGSTDLLRETMVVASGGPSSIEVVLSDDVATLNGTVDSADASKGRPMVLIVPESAPQAIKTIYVGGNGQFYANGLAPGRYKIFAFDHLDGLEYLDPDVLREYASKAAEITLQPNEAATVKVDLVQIGE